MGPRVRYHPENVTAPAPLHPTSTAEPAPAPDATPSEPRPEVKWLVDHPVVLQAVLYLRTFGAFSAHPHRFAREWSSGAEAMNPLTFMATSAALLGLATKVCYAAVTDRPSGLWYELTSSIGLYVYYAIVSLVCHLALKPFGARKSWHGSLAIGLFAGGTLAFATRLVGTGVLWVLRWQDGVLASTHYSRSSIPLAVLFLSSLLWFFGALGLGLAGLHGLRRRVALAVVLVPLVGTSFVARWVEIPVPHLRFGVQYDGHSFGYDLDIHI